MKVLAIVRERKHERTNWQSINNNLIIEFNGTPADTYKCRASETVLVNTSCENEFSSIAPGENVRRESLTNDIFYEEHVLTIHTYFLLKKFVFRQREKYISR